MSQKLSSALKLLLSILLAAVFLFLAFRGANWAEFLAGFKTTNWLWVFLSVVAAYAALVFRAERWHLQLVVLNPEIDRKTIWQGSNIGNLLSIILPGSGEFVRCGIISAGKVGYDKVLGTIFVERLWDLMAVALLLLLAFVGSSSLLGPFIKENMIEPLSELTSGNLPWIAGAVCLLVIIFIAAAFILRTKSKFFTGLVSAVKGVFAGFAAFGKIKGKFLFILYTIGIWFMYILMTYFTFLAVPGVDMLTFVDSVFISAVGNIASVIPTPGNLGAYHYLVGMAISNLYQGSVEISSSSLLFATISHGAHALLLIVLGLISYFCKLNKHKN